MSGRNRCSAFSLLEVMIAVGLFAASVTIIIALIPFLMRQSAASGDAMTARRLPDAIRVELARLATVGGFDSLALATPEMNSGSVLLLVATRDGARLHALEYLPPVTGRIDAAGQYFLIECERYGEAPLSYSAQHHFLAIAVRVSWPYRVPGVSDPTPIGTRSTVRFPVSLKR